MIGTCALCRKEADLQDSHLIPKWAYKRVCEADPVGAKTPVHVASGNAVLSNSQTTAYLLCADCEMRFAKHEDYVARLTRLENGQIKLLKHVTRLATPKGVLASLSNEVDAERIVYFAVSIMWRACVMTGGCRLGAYEPRFRQYLLDEVPFPRDAVISLGLFKKSPIIDSSGWVTEPSSTKANTLWLHGFMVAGMIFRCFVGKAIKPEWRQVSLAGPNSKKYVSILKPEECADFLAAAEMAANAQHRGKLATAT